MPNKRATSQAYWGLMRMIVICTTLCIVLGLFLAFNYNRFDTRDWVTIMGTISAVASALLGMQKLESKITGKCKEKECDHQEEHDPET